MVIKEKSSKLKEFFSFILENILTLSTITVGIVIYAKSQPNPPATDQSLGLIFGLLATLVISDYITRLKYLNKFRKDLDTLLGIAKNSHSVFVKTIPFKEELENSNEVLIVTNTGHRTIGTHDESLEEFLNNAGKVCIILMNPEDDSPATEMAASRSPKQYGAGYYQTRINNTLKELANAKRLSQDAGSIIVRTLDIAPAYGLYIFQPNSPNARLYVRIFSQFDSLNKSQNLLVLKSQYPELFAYYLNQYNLIYKHSKQIDLE